MVSEMDMDRSSGQMVQNMKVIGVEIKPTVKVN
jgi:hypothetical protein